MTEKILCVDLSNQIYKAAAVHPHLTSGQKHTGGLYGVIKAIADAINETDATAVVVCRDVKPYIRTDEYPQYKAFRKTEIDENLVKLVSETKPLVKEFCEAVGMPIWGIPGFEADDLAAYITQTAYTSDVVSASNDSDLYQLFDSVRYSIWKGKGKIYTQADFMNEFPEITPGQYIQMLALTGTHNEVEGIPRVGPITAMKLLRNPADLRRVLEQHGELVERNMGLIRLPHKAFPKDTPIPESPRIFSAQKLYRFCARYEINVRKDWVDAFEATLT